MKATESQNIVEFVRRFQFKPRYFQCLADMSRFAFYVLKTLFMTIYAKKQSLVFIIFIPSALNNIPIKST